MADINKKVVVAKRHQFEITKPIITSSILLVICLVIVIAGSYFDAIGLTILGLILMGIATIELCCKLFLRIRNNRLPENYIIYQDGVFTIYGADGEQQIHKKQISDLYYSPKIKNKYLFIPNIFTRVTLSSKIYNYGTLNLLVNENGILRPYKIKNVSDVGNPEEKINRILKQKNTDKAS